MNKNFNCCDSKWFCCDIWALLIDNIRFQSFCTYRVFHDILPRPHMFIGPIFESNHQCFVSTRIFFTRIIRWLSACLSACLFVCRWRKSKYFLNSQFVRMLKRIVKLVFRIEEIQSFLVNWHEKGSLTNKIPQKSLDPHGVIFSAYSTIMNWIKSINPHEDISSHISPRT
jgi:hypothetical protein